MRTYPEVPSKHSRVFLDGASYVTPLMGIVFPNVHLWEGLMSPHPRLHWLLGLFDKGSLIRKKRQIALNSPLQDSWFFFGRLGLQMSRGPDPCHVICEVNVCIGNRHTKTPLNHWQVNAELSLSVISEVSMQEKPSAGLESRSHSVRVAHCKRPSVPFGKSTMIAKSPSYHYNIYYSLVCNKFIWTAETVIDIYAPPSVKT